MSEMCKNRTGQEKSGSGKERRGKGIMKLKVGCKVKIIPNLNENMENVVFDMEKYAGKVAIIKDIRNNSFYILDIDNEKWKWNENYVEEVKDFTLADLKPCMVVELRNGWIGRIEEVKRGLCVSVVNKKTDWNELNDYNEDLTYNGSCGNGWDIMKVYGFCDYGCGKYLLNTEYRELLWERIEKSPQQLKLEELETKQREIADEMAKLRKEME
jgi:hypothetical protein